MEVSYYWPHAVVAAWRSGPAAELDGLNYLPGSYCLTEVNEINIWGANYGGRDWAGHSIGGKDCTS